MNNGQAKRGKIRMPQEIEFEARLDKLVETLRMVSTDFVLLVGNEHCNAAFGHIHGPSPVTLMGTMLAHHDGVRETVLKGLTLAMGGPAAMDIFAPAEGSGGPSLPDSTPAP